jgi:transketolase
VFVHGSTPTAHLVKLLPKLDERGLNVKIVATVSPQLFRLQDAAYRDETVSVADRWDGMAITHRAFKLMRDWVDGPIAQEYSLASDWDNRWRTGGTVDEVMDEAHLSPDHILAGIERFVRDREERRGMLRQIAEAAASR